MKKRVARVKAISSIWLI